MSRFRFSRVDPSAWPRADGRLDISRIDGAVVPTGRLELEIGPSKIGGHYMRAWVRSSLPGTPRREHFLTGLFNDGPYPGQNWIEVIDLDLPPPVHLEPGFETALVPYLAPVAAVIPRGGHLMVEYEKSMWIETQLGLLAGIPPLATRMGAMLYDIGCGDSFKDWYFPEGGQEGGRKLQGNRAYTDQQSLEMARQRAGELEHYLAAPSRGDAAFDARARATAVRIFAELQARLS